MKPAKSIVPVANWVLRGALALYLLWPYVSDIGNISFKTNEQITGALLAGFALLLFVGGFVRNAALTILSAGALSLVSLYFVFVNLDWPLTPGYLVCLWPLATGIHFMARGNQ